MFSDKTTLGLCSAMACFLIMACSDSETTVTGAGGGGGAAVTGGMGGAGATGGDATGGATGGTAGMGGSGAMGGAPPTHPGVLVDDGLVVRYYMDEATTGQGPTELLDAAPDPLDLPITYIPEMAYTQDAPGMTGIEWDAAELDGRPTASANGTKIVTALHTSTTATVEMVLAFTDVSGSNSRLFYLGQGSDTGRLTVSTPSVYFLRFTVNEDRVASSFFDSTPAGRFVLHAVYDTAQATPEERARFYVNGGRLQSFGTTPPDLNDAISIPADQDIAIGNRESGGRSINGTIYYAAVYSDALTDDDILQNALLLLENDDTPAP